MENNVLHSFNIFLARWPSLIGGDQQMDDSFLYVESFVYDQSETSKKKIKTMQFIFSLRKVRDIKSDLKVT